MAGPTDYSMTVGVQLLGHFLNTYLYGIVTFQFVVYWNSGYKDPIWLKSLMIALFVMDTVHSCVAVYQAWEMCVLNYANPGYLAFISWTISFTGCANAITSVLSQTFLMHRLYVLTRNKYVVGCAAILSFGALIFGFLCGIRSAMLHEVARFPEVYNVVIAWLTFQITSDIFITCGLTFVLVRSKTGIRSTEKVLNRLIRGAIQTGFFATLFGLGHMLSFLCANDTSLHGFFVYPIGRIYTNTLLDSLNSRKKLRRELRRVS
ncbi:hypothetical protein BDZ89DRAFT_500480 [Hymenopellis radicata]|nr:hypothetical protein BDZ89DRAFT_500480 [Hymenopellis radicata]